MILEYLMAVRIEITGDSIKKLLDLKYGINLDHMKITKDKNNEKIKK